MSEDPSQVVGWLSMVPLVIYALLFAAIVIWLAPKKGKSPWLAMIAVVPCLGPLVMIYLLSLTDKKVLDEIAELKRRLG